MSIGQGRDCAVGLISMVPQTILGNVAQRASIVGEARTNDTYGAVGKAIATCVGRQADDVTTAYASATYGLDVGTCRA